MSDYAHTARDLPEASLRDLTTRYLELLDLSVRSRFGQQPVAVGEALERLAVSEAISRYAHNGRQVDILAALNAVASWRDVADVLDAPQALSSARSSHGGSTANESCTTHCRRIGRGRDAWV